MVALDEIDSPLGGVTLAHDGDRLYALAFHEHWPRVAATLARRQARLERGASSARIRAALAAYFAGQHAAIESLAVEPGGTPFQQRVWSALRKIPRGQTTSYGALARSIGAPQAVRAVGLANGSNPISIVIPCHRVIGADGSLTGYGGGLERKRWLLAHEGVIARELARD